MTMRTTLLAASALVMASIAGVVVPEAARAQGAVPPGSYLQTCNVASVNSITGELSAVCKPKERCGWFPGSGCDLVASWLTSLYYTDCVGDIANNDGNLYCAYDQAKVAARLKREQQAQADAAKAAAAERQAQYEIELSDQIAAATPALRSAAVIVLGRDLGTGELERLGRAARSLAYQQERVAMMAKEFDFAVAAAFLKKYLTRPNGEQYRNDAVDLAFGQVYGRKSTPGEQVDYYNRISAGQSWYATIVADQMKAIAPGEQVRIGMAQRVAENGFGRDPALDELKQWTGSGQNFGLMLEGVRQTLWSGSNADPLVQTVTRALAKLGRPTDDGAVKAAIAAWRPMRPVYAEMVSPFGKAKLGNGRPPLIRG